MSHANYEPKLNAKHEWSIGAGAKWLWPSVLGAFLFGCSSAQSADTSATGASAALGGHSGSSLQAAGGGAANTGGSIARGAGGGLSAGGTTNQAGGLATGGTVATNSGGASQDASAGGTRMIGGSRAFGGANSGSLGGAKVTGGAFATGGDAHSAGTSALGGAEAIGGSAPTGGSGGLGGTATNGGTISGGSGNADRCDVGVQDVAKPPRALTLSGNLGAHDPAMLFQASNGTYYEFQTGLGAKTSTNLTSWSAAAVPFTAPAWLQTAVPGVTDLWAPDVSYFDGRYHLYYAGSTFGKNRSCIGHATRVSLDSGSWVDQGLVICSNVGTSDDWNAIDPNVIIDTDETPWLDFGSFWSGIKLIQLDQHGARAATTVPTSIADRPKNGGALEGPFIVRRCGYYYLFTSWDACCKGVDSTYNIRVVRSTSVTGPYADKAGVAALAGGGTLIAEGNETTWAGPGGQSVMFVGNKAYLVYHAYSISNNGAATLRIAELVWDSSGWPVAVGP